MQGFVATPIVDTAESKQLRLPPFIYVLMCLFISIKITLCVYFEVDNNGCKASLQCSW